MALETWVDVIDKDFPIVREDVKVRYINMYTRNGFRVYLRDALTTKGLEERRRQLEEEEKNYFSSVIEEHTPKVENNLIKKIISYFYLHNS